MAGLAVTADGWTVAEASAQFGETGIPFEERNLRAVIRYLPGFQRTGETPSGPHGGRGDPLYDIAELQLLHKALARWLTVPVSGDTRSLAVDNR